MSLGEQGQRTGHEPFAGAESKIVVNVMPDPDSDPFLCVLLQRVGNSHRSRCALSDLRHVAKPGDRQCRHDLQFGIRNHQRVEVE